MKSVLKTFLDKVDKFGNSFDYSNVDSTLLLARRPIEIICKEHGAFSVLARTHTESDYGCKLCRQEALRVSRVKKMPLIDNALLEETNPMMKWI
jgi:hypothetical protein